jgi:hypothetical protein
MFQLKNNWTYELGFVIELLRKLRIRCVRLYMDLASVGCQQHYFCCGQTKDLLSSSYFNTSSSSEVYCICPHSSQTNAGIGHDHSFPNPLYSFQCLFQPIQDPGLLFSSLIIFHRR